MKYLVLFVCLLFIAGCSSEDKPEENNLTDNFSVNGTFDDINNSINESVNNSINESANMTDNGSGEISVSCLDSDGGKIYTTKGMIVYEGAKYLTVSDYCESDTRLIEYYCKNDSAIGTELYTCVDSICLNGFCGVINSSVNGTNSS